MSFFKADKKFTDESIPEQGYGITKPRYVIDKEGKGRWIKPIPPMPTDYDEDVIY